MFLYYVYLFLFFFVPIHGGCRCCIILVVLMFVSHEFSLFWFLGDLVFRITRVTIGPQSLRFSFLFHLCDLFPQIAWVIREDRSLEFQIDRSLNLNKVWTQNKVNSSINIRQYYDNSKIMTPVLAEQIGPKLAGHNTTTLLVLLVNRILTAHSARAAHSI